MWCLSCLFNPFKRLHFLPLWHHPVQKSSFLDLIDFNSRSVFSATQPPHLRAFFFIFNSNHSRLGDVLKIHLYLLLPTCLDQTLFSLEWLLLFFPLSKLANSLLPFWFFNYTPTILIFPSLSPAIPAPSPPLASPRNEWQAEHSHQRLRLWSLMAELWMPVLPLK